MRDQMLVIVDNGKGSDVARLVRGSKEIVKPSDDIKKASAIILSDGDMKHQKANVKIIEKFNKPLLGIGAGAVFLAAAYGAKPKEAKAEKMDMVKIERPCPLTLDLKKIFSVMQSCNYTIDELPENFGAIASSSKNPFQIFLENEKPFFGVHFNPEMGGDGMRVIDNFVKFVEVWEKYHKG